MPDIRPVTPQELAEIRQAWATPSAQRQPLPPALRDRAARDINCLIATIDHGVAIAMEQHHA